MSADWWLTGIDSVECQAAGHEWDAAHEWNLTYNLNRMLWEAGWQWPYEDGTPSAAPKSSLPNAGVWSSKSLDGVRASDLGEKVLMVVTRLREQPTFFQQWDPPNQWGNYHQALEVFESFLAAIEAHPNARLGVSF